MKNNLETILCNKYSSPHLIRDIKMSYLVSLLQFQRLSEIVITFTMQYIHDMIDSKSDTHILIKIHARL